MGHNMVVSIYAIPIGILRVDRLSTRPSGFRASQYVSSISNPIRFNTQFMEAYF